HDASDKVWFGYQFHRSDLNAGMAILFRRKDCPDRAASIRLSYLVANCGWSPTYTLRTEAEQNEVRVECHGLVQQMTGEDWNEVELTLSTASPALSASGPGLASFPICFSSPGVTRE
ncbi:MAG: DUF4139 domain-containing protein, partial [Erysipelotrichaceae bacterium]|nr:DUF4139 domain-containing protein [Erysipelotrichaceae bacterium]